MTSEFEELQKILNPTPPIPEKKPEDALEIYLSQALGYDPNRNMLEGMGVEPTSSSPSQEDEIDWDFIRELEGFETEGYVPDPEGSQSGVTVGSGFDLGSRTEESLRDLGAPSSLIEKISPYLGVRKKEAEDLLKKNPLVLNEDEAELLTQLGKKETMKRIRTKFGEKDFNKLTPEQKTVLMSVGFQYGNQLFDHNFWDQTKEGRWEDAYKNLLNYGDAYKTRREKEASYLVSKLNQGTA